MTRTMLLSWKWFLQKTLQTKIYIDKIEIEYIPFTILETDDEDYEAKDLIPLAQLRAQLPQVTNVPRNIFQMQPFQWQKRNIPT